MDWGVDWDWIGPCPPVRNDIVTPRHFFSHKLCSSSQQFLLNFNLADAPPFLLLLLLLDPFPLIKSGFRIDASRLFVFTMPRHPADANDSDPRVSGAKGVCPSALRGHAGRVYRSVDERRRRRARRQPIRFHVRSQQTLLSFHDSATHDGR